MQTDPIGYGDGMNSYAYVGNDPVNWVDSSGTLRIVCSSYGTDAWTSVTPHTDDDGVNDPIVENHPATGASGCFDADADAGQNRSTEDEGTVITVHGRRPYLKRLGKIFNCAADTANKASLPGLLGVDPHDTGLVAQLAYAAGGNVFSGAVYLGDDLVAYGKNISGDSGSEETVASANDLTRDEILGGVTQGFPMLKGAEGAAGVGGVVGDSALGWTAVKSGLIPIALIDDSNVSL